MSWRLISENGSTSWIHVSANGIEQRFGFADRKTSRMLSPGKLKKLVQPEDFEFDRELNPNSGDRFFRALQLSAFKDTNKKSQPPCEADIVDDSSKAQAMCAARKGFDFYTQLQQSEGFWTGDYGGPLFLLPGLIIASHCCGLEIPIPFRKQMTRFILNHRLPKGGGGWGLHIEMNQSTAFGTALNYVALRLLGEEAQSKHMKHALNCLHALGGCGCVPPWGKFWLAVLGVYEWEGVDTLIPELWSLPTFLPIHPSRWWCHCRMVYLPMAYLYAKRFVGPHSQLIEDLRSELYPNGYDKTCWSQLRSMIAPGDIFYPAHPVYLFVIKLANIYERFHSSWLRNKAIQFIYAYICQEDVHTDYIDIGPVSKAINMVCRFAAEGRESDSFKRHAERAGNYLWLAEDGMKMQGYNGSACWDTSFAGLALSECKLTEEFSNSVSGIYKFLQSSQIIEENENFSVYFRHHSIGGWPFSTREHGWPVVDTTATALLAILQLQSDDVKYSLSISSTIHFSRIFKSIDCILSLQNSCGGWGTYELQRAPSILEVLNSSYIFGDIIVEHSYVELSSSAMQALLTFLVHYPEYRRKDIQRSIRAGVLFIISQQLKDGGFYSSWAVCFTYGTWFAIEALTMSARSLDLCVKADEKLRTKIDQCVRKAVSFLLHHQRVDGGWGESYESCVQKKYIEHEDTQVVNTSWALLALMAADVADFKQVEKGIALLIQRQKSCGDWDQEGISGQFNSNCMITYTSYRNVFPLRALGRFAHWKTSGDKCVSLQEAS